VPADRQGGFRKNLTSLVNGTFNICSDRESHFYRKIL